MHQKSKNLPPKIIESILERRAKFYLISWLPGGFCNDQSYYCAGLRGGRYMGKGLVVNVKTGEWKDYETDLSGPTFLSLYQAIYELGPRAALMVIS